MSTYEKRALAPWSVLANSWQYTTIYDAMGDPICRLDLEDWGVNEDNQSQLEMEQARIAALLVSAPEMFAALEGAMVIIDLLPWPHELGTEVSAALSKRKEAIRAAIARARGDQS